MFAPSGQLHLVKSKILFVLQLATWTHFLVLNSIKKYPALSPSIKVAHLVHNETEIEHSMQYEPDAD